MPALPEQLVNINLERAEFFEPVLKFMWRRLDPKTKNEALKRLSAFRNAANGDVIAQAEVVAIDAEATDLTWGDRLF